MWISCNVTYNALGLTRFALSFWYGCKAHAQEELLTIFLWFVFAVGKTSLITRFMYDSFDNTYQVRNSDWVGVGGLSLQALMLVQVAE